MTFFEHPIDLLRRALERRYGQGRIDFAAYAFPDRMDIEIRLTAPPEVVGIDFRYSGREDDIEHAVPWARIDSSLGVFNRMLVQRINGLNAPTITPPYAEALTYNDITHVNRYLEGAMGTAPRVYNTNPTFPVPTPVTGVDLERFREMLNTDLANGRDRMAVNTAVRADNSLVMRTAEQEDRMKELELKSHGAILTREESREYDSLIVLTSYIAPEGARTRVRVKVKKVDRGYRGTSWGITVEVIRARESWTPIPLPSTVALKPYIPEAERHFISGRTSFQESLDSGLNPTSLKDALMEWVRVKESQPAETIGDSQIDDEAISLLRMMPAMLEVGGKVFRLVPTGEADVRPLITRVRERALTVAKRESAEIKGRATTDAKIVVKEAEDRARIIRNEIEELRREEGQKPPDWIKGIPHFLQDGAWCVEMRVACQITDVRYTINSWQTVLHWKPLVIPGKDLSYYNSRRMPLWLRLGENGAYNLDSVFMRNWTVAHISHRCCMELQGLPPRINNLADFMALQIAISRGMTVVNMNSLLDRSLMAYYPDFKEQLPPVIVGWLQGVIRIQSERLTLAQHKLTHPSVTWDAEEGIVQESDSTFRVDDPRLIRPAVTATGMTANTTAATYNWAQDQVALATPNAVPVPALPDIPGTPRRTRQG